MLILCIGPDTFRAQEKAHELEVAFRQKFDLSGSSMERLSVGKDAIKQILERANTASLFSPRRLMRTSDLLLECPKSSQAPLINALTMDPENVIVISVESELPPDVTMKLFSSVPKFVKYDFPTQTGNAFLQWIREKAKGFGYQDEQRIARLAATSDGDSWLAWNELLKLVAGSTEDLQRNVTPKIYDFAEKYLKGGDKRYSVLLGKDVEDGEALSVFISQARAAIRVRDADVEGLHPYLVKKMQNVSKNSHNLDVSLSVLLHALLCQRIEYGTEEDVFGMI